jgi:selenocysteine-specific elongation factor
MSMRHLVLGTAGHIDHGKTALVRALTGVDTDRLEEERRRGITIELGFAPWRLAEEIEASIIDVPGHERLVRTMVAGAGGMDLAMLVVAADDGVMPQTQEHLDVLRLLGVPKGILVLTKCDLVDEELHELVEEDVRNTCAGTVFENAPTVRTSAKTGAGLDELRRLVLSAAAKVEARPSEGPVFLPLDRLFTKAGYGTVGTGTTLRGRLAVGDQLEAFGEEAAVDGLKVRGLQALGSAKTEVLAGMRTAVNLTGRRVDEVKRGMVLAHAGAFCAVESCIVWADVLPKAQPLTQETVTAHLGTAEREATVIPLGSDRIDPGENGGALVRFGKPVAAYAGQRMVLRRPGLHGQATVAGGVVLDPEPPHGKRSVSIAAAQVGALRGSPKERLLALARESRASGIGKALHRRLPPGVGRKALTSLEREGQLVRVSPHEERWIARDLADDLVSRVVALVASHHDRSPLSYGLAEAEVVSQLPPPEQHLAGLAVQRAVDGGKLVRDAALVAIPGRGGAVDGAAKEELERVRTLYSAAGLTPPNEVEVATELGFERKRLQDILGLLRRQGVLVRVSETLHFDAGALAGLEAAVVEKLATQEQMSAPEFKELAGGVSRKWAIPLLEYFDRCRVTLRVGDARKLHPSRRT